MNIFSAHFLFFFSFFFIIYHLSGKNKHLLFLTNLLFIMTYCQTPLSIAPLIIFVGHGFFWVVLLKKKRHPLFAALSILSTLTIFIFLKKYSFVTENLTLHFYYSVIGMSYILFRQIHLFVDIYQGEINGDISFVEYFNYICFFLSLISGPITLFKKFSAEGHQEKHSLSSFTREKTYAVFSRLINGMIKISFSAYFFLPLFNKCLKNMDMDSILFPLIFSAASIIYLIHLYLNFSGYMDMVISLGHFIGYEMPENFIKPFESKSFLDLWSRWHISLSEWFKTYVFNPLMKFFASKINSTRLTLYFGATAYFITFLLMGFWHGTTVSFLIYGVYLGFGTSINKFADARLKKSSFKDFYEKAQNNFLGQICFTGLSIGYFSVGLACIWLSKENIISLFTREHFSFLVPSILLSSLFIIIIRFSNIAINYLCEQLYEKFKRLVDMEIAKQAFLFSRILILILLVALTFKSTPEFIYRTF